MASTSLLGAVGVCALFACFHRRRSARILPSAAEQYEEIGTQHYSLRERDRYLNLSRLRSWWSNAIVMLFFVFGASLKLFLALLSSQGAAAWLFLSRFATGDNATIATYMSSLAPHSPAIESTISLCRMWELRDCFSSAPSVGQDLSGLAPFDEGDSLTEVLRTGSPSSILSEVISNRKGEKEYRLVPFVL